MTRHDLFKLSHSSFCLDGARTLRERYPDTHIRIQGGGYKSIGGHAGLEHLAWHGGIGVALLGIHTTYMWLMMDRLAGRP